MGFKKNPLMKLNQMRARMTAYSDPEVSGFVTKVACTENGHETADQPTQAIDSSIITDKLMTCKFEPHLANPSCRWRGHSHPAHE